MPAGKAGMWIMRSRVLRTESRLQFFLGNAYESHPKIGCSSAAAARCRDGRCDSIHARLGDLGASPARGSDAFRAHHPATRGHQRAANGPQLAPLAVTPWEREYAQEALRLADRSVDLAFTAALNDAKENPAPLTTETRPLVARVKDADARLNVDQDRVAQLTDALAKARPSAKDDVQDQLDLAKAQMSLDQDELDDAHEDLTRAGGDKLSLVQAQLDQHEASEAHTGKSPAPRLRAARRRCHPPNPRRRRTCWRKSKRFSRCARRKVSCCKRGKMLWIASPNIRPSMKLSKSNWTMKKYRKRS